MSHMFGSSLNKRCLFLTDISFSMPERSAARTVPVTEHSLVHKLAGSLVMLAMLMNKNTPIDDTKPYVCSP